jgi:hypothetical protein
MKDKNRKRTADGFFNLSVVSLIFKNINVKMVLQVKNAHLWGTHWEHLQLVGGFLANA